jgi:hypothetical protein
MWVMIKSRRLALIQQNPPLYSKKLRIRWEKEPDEISKNSEPQVKHQAKT